MNHPLDGARLKVVRAQGHLNSLKSEIGTYLDTPPYEFFADNDIHDPSQAPFRITLEPPPRCSFDHW